MGPPASPERPDARGAGVATQPPGEVGGAASHEVPASSMTGSGILADRSLAGEPP